jgi:DNA-binding NarL/FixJ family response regulator
VIRVVVVDDHGVVREGLVSILSATDDLVCVGAAADGETGVDLVERTGPDVLVLDLSMPGWTGVDVLRALRARGCPVRVLVLTSFSDPDLVLEAVRAGADGYLLKRSEAEAIIEGIRCVAAGVAPLDPAVARSLLASPRGAARHAEELTGREAEVLELLRAGCPNKVIARRLQISERTVKAHVTRILQRTGAADRTQAALWAERHLREPAAPGGTP